MSEVNATDVLEETEQLLREANRALSVARAQIRQLAAQVATPVEHAHPEA